MTELLTELRNNRLLWLLVFVPGPVYCGGRHARGAHVALRPVGPRDRSAGWAAESGHGVRRRRIRAGGGPGARKDRLDLSAGIALGSASQIALFVAPALVLLSYVIGPTPMDLRFWPGAVVMMLIATLTTSLVTNGGRSAWFVGVLVLMVYWFLP